MAGVGVQTLSKKSFAFGLGFDLIRVIRGLNSLRVH